MAYNSLEAIAQANVPVLLPDTCILLDLLRSPRRENVDGNAMLAGRAIRDGVVQSEAIGCVVAEQVRNELNDNLQTVREDTNLALTKLQDEIARIDKWSEALGQVSQTQIGHFLTRVPIAEAVMTDILGAALTHATTPDLTYQAVVRMSQKRTPAKLGKDSTKDCVVVESYLDVATNLRNLGLTADIIFASSNTKEFVSGTPRALNADIAADFAALGILYSRALHETRHLLGLPQPQ
ncbi:hypothetical protein KM176_24030 [Pseudooceanicola sp. CBS1P-1]|uniref:DUF4935 domain-containing protein n=1 Tax=Pseudooceanicola albus TaxID=2692189 RepID=A0A6L7GBZ2_9RHOB|nr:MULTISPECIES: hypothetical protein [Pseudooceanicola]MBT9386932.1 hypothetical protein [Pseudooceanicola endophyticus]MXN21058.1 hypothetical protein [Pseudooceanicola albus]